MTVVGTRREPLEALADAAARLAASDDLDAALALLAAAAPEAAGVAGRVVGSLELVRVASPFDGVQQTVAQLIAAQLALAVRTLGGDGGPSPQTRSRWLELAGEALAAGVDARRAAQQGLRVAVEATGARAGAIWRLGGDGPELVASHGELGPAQGRLERLV